MMKKYKKRTSKLKFKYLILSCIFIISIIATSIFSSPNGYITLATDNNESVQSDNIKPKDDYLTINKCVKEDPNVKGQYRITLKAEGKPISEEQKKADIILVVDKSSSMEDKIEEIKKSLKNFCSIIRKTNADVNICLVEFGNDASAKDFVSINNEVNDKYSIDKDIDDIIINADFSGTGTNTQAGIMKAGEMLKESRKEAQKYVVLFTDGLPTYSYNYDYQDIYKYGLFHKHFVRRDIDYNNFKIDYDGNYDLIGYGDCGHDVHYKGAEIEYNKIIGGISEIGEKGAIETPDSDWWDAYQTNNIEFDDIKDKVKQENYKASFYSIGIITGDMTQKQRGIAESFLKKLNNSGYKYGNDINEADKFYTSIATDITAKINSTIATDVTISDKLTEYFKFGDDINMQGIDKSKCEFSNNDKTITFNVGDMRQNLEISFDIKLDEDDYFSGDDIPTNEEARIKYINPVTGKEAEQVYNIPSISIKPKVGKIYISKEIMEVSGKGNVINNQIKNNDNFFVKIKNDSHSYNLNACTNETKSFEFYMKDKDTNIDHAGSNTDEDMGFVNIGSYTVEEIIKMRYQLDSIEYSYDGTNYKKLDSAIKIDKDHQNIYIKLINKFNNSSTWTDDDEKNNNFTYPIPIG